MELEKFDKNKQILIYEFENKGYYQIEVFYFLMKCLGYKYVGILEGGLENFKKKLILNDQKNKEIQKNLNKLISLDILKKKEIQEEQENLDNFRDNSYEDIVINDDNIKQFYEDIKGVCEIVEQKQQQNNKQIQKKDKNYILIDVRNEYEYMTDKIPGAINISYQKFFEIQDGKYYLKSEEQIKQILLNGNKEFFEKIFRNKREIEDKNENNKKQIILYCQSGFRSSVAFTVLQSLFQKSQISENVLVKNYFGSYQEWEMNIGMI
ncbi:Rhodanese-like domain [Pseudocohnilembus persalinus]|uniref:Rhodanese-like domain n=1 Tax=Pseudocohnilembus persalinus TaxID=266149 RepID=A0A0V0R843_PSEPJ|nr:Rhodanese-like domain [Pseudocohnilembus persalinus]|eukprot:KRX10663.1 Rhodanese-like domain [Pseudocohnilembus persalinus]